MKIKSAACLIPLICAWLAVGGAIIAVFFLRPNPLTLAPRLGEETPVSSLPFVPPIIFATPTRVGTIDFSGHSWVIKAPQIKAEPGPNLWSSSKENVWVDENGRLHLRITKRNNVWYSAEIFSDESFGYGTYRLSVDTDLNFDPNVAAGFFTWSEDPAFNHREMDIEFSIWTNVTAQKNAQYVLQPYTVPQNIHYFVQPLGPSIHSFTWQSNKVIFQSNRRVSDNAPAPNSVIGQWTFTTNVPRPGAEKVHINYWLVEGRVPKNGQESEMIVDKFEFLPANP